MKKMNNEQEETNKFSKLPMILGICIGIVVIAGIIIECSISNAKIYNSYELGKECLEQNNYNDAYYHLKDLPEDYKNTYSLLQEANTGRFYYYGKTAMDDKRYAEAVASFSHIESYEDSDKLLSESKYQLAIKNFNDGYYEMAEGLFEKLGNYKKSKKYYVETILLMEDKQKDRLYKQARKLYDDKEYALALDMLNHLKGWKDSKDMAMKCKERIG